MTTNPNVKLVLLYRLLDGVGTGIWGLTVLVTYISLCEQGFSPDEVGEAACRCLMMAPSQPQQLNRPQNHALHLQKVGLAEALRGTCLALAALIGKPMLASHCTQARRWLLGPFLVL
jgi:hypothetical protein